MAKQGLMLQKQGGKADRPAPKWKVGAAVDLDIVSREAWDGAAAKTAVLNWARNADGEIQVSKARRGFLVHDSANPDLTASYKLPFADIVGGELKAVDAGLRAAASRLPQTDAPTAVLNRARGVLDGYFKRLNKAIAILTAWEGVTKNGDGGVVTMEWKTVPFSVKQINGRTVTGVAAVYGNKDEGHDVLHLGSAAKTIRERLKRIKFLWHHDWQSPPTAVIDDLREVTRDELPQEIVERYPEATGGLEVTRTYLTHERAEAAFQAVKSGAVTEMSIGYDPVVIDLEDDEETGARLRNLREIRLWELSDVLWGMNAATVASKALAMPLHALSTQVVMALTAADVLSEQDQEAVRLIAKAVNAALPETDKGEPPDNSPAAETGDAPTPATSKDTAEPDEDDVDTAEIDEDDVDDTDTAEIDVDDVDTAEIDVDDVDDVDTAEIDPVTNEAISGADTPLDMDEQDTATEGQAAPDQEALTLPQRLSIADLELFELEAAIADL